MPALAAPKIFGQVLIAKYTVVRVGDEICVDLMASTSGIGYEKASQDQIIRVVDGVPIPFASPACSIG